jgi:hypothetical protein
MPIGRLPLIFQVLFCSCLYLFRRRFPLMHDAHDSWVLWSSPIWSDEIRHPAWFLKIPTDCAWYTWCYMHVERTQWYRPHSSILSNWVGVANDGGMRRDCTVWLQLSTFSSGNRRPQDGRRTPQLKYGVERRGKYVLYNNRKENCGVISVPLDTRLPGRQRESHRISPSLPHYHGKIISKAVHIQLLKIRNILSLYHYFS